MSGKSEQFNTRLDPDDAAAVKEYADEHGVTKSEATRRFIRAGRDVLDEDEAEDEHELISAGAGQVETWYQVGGTPERVAGIGLAAIIPALVALGLFGPGVAATVGTLMLGVVVYFATVALGGWLREVAE